MVTINYGTEDGVNYFVQQSCNKEHDGLHKCECKGYGETFTSRQARKLAKKLGHRLKLCVEHW